VNESCSRDTIFVAENPQCSRGYLGALRSSATAQSEAMQSAIPVPRFTVAIHRAKGCYFARVMQLPGCLTQGSTEVEAVENARAAIRAYLVVEQLLETHRATVELEIRP
jgi:predicted RNase H-like HicB family nuclease